MRGSGRASEKQGPNSKTGESHATNRKKYAAMLREAFEPFVLCLPKTAEVNLLQDSLSEEELKRFPLFAALALLHPLKV